jgi:hypothetical protein
MPSTGPLAASSTGTAPASIADQTYVALSLLTLAAFIGAAIWLMTVGARRLRTGRGPRLLHRCRHATRGRLDEPHPLAATKPWTGSWQDPGIEKRLGHQRVQYPDRGRPTEYCLVRCRAQALGRSQDRRGGFAFHHHERLQECRQACRRPDARIQSPSDSGLGSTGGFSFKLQDRSGSTPQALAKVADDFIAAAKQRPEIGQLYTKFNPNTPAFSLELDREKAKKLGVPISDVTFALQTFLGGVDINDFSRFGRTFKVTMQAEPEYRSDIQGIGLFHVRSATDRWCRSRLWCAASTHRCTDRDPTLQPLPHRRHRRRCRARL